jgi:AraC-like DNA-binding protein
VDIDLAILDAGITTDAYRALEPTLARALGAEAVRQIRAALDDASTTQMGCAEAMRLFDAVVAVLAPAGAAPSGLDARIRRVMDLVDQRPFDETSLSVLAREVGLSESRLRDLFRKTLGCPLSQYARWVAAWKAIHLWKKGMTFTDVAHAVGFHDLAHADHALGETFGMSPSEMARIDLQRCGG